MTQLDHENFELQQIQDWHDSTGVYATNAMQMPLMQGNKVADTPQGGVLNEKFQWAC